MLFLKSHFQSWKSNKKNLQALPETFQQVKASENRPKLPQKDTFIFTFHGFWGANCYFQGGYLEHIQCFLFWESTLEGKVSHHLKRGTMFEMLARKYPETLHTMMWRRMVCRSLKFFPIWIRSIQIADMHLRQKTFFLTKDYFTVSRKPQPPHPHLLPSQILMRFPFFHSTTRNSQRLKNFKAFVVRETRETPFFLALKLPTSSCATWGTWIKLKPF